MAAARSQAGLQRDCSGPGSTVSARSSKMAHEQPPQEEVTPLAQFRFAKDVFYRTSADSPLTDEQRREFEGLSYFPENEAFVFAVDPQPFDKQELVTIPTTTDDAAQYVRWAKAPLQI